MRAVSRQALSSRRYAAALDDEHRPFTQVWAGAQHTPWQQTVLGPHAVLAQHMSFGLGAQKAPLVAVIQHFPVFGQQSPCAPQAVYPFLHASGVASWPAARLTPSAPRTPPANTPAASLSAWRRGAGFARIRATSSNKDSTFVFFLSFAQTLQRSAVAQFSPPRSQLMLLCLSPIINRWFTKSMRK